MKLVSSRFNRSSCGGVLASASCSQRKSSSTQVTEQRGLLRNKRVVSREGTTSGKARKTFSLQGQRRKLRLRTRPSATAKVNSDAVDPQFIKVAHKAADAAAKVTRKYFRCELSSMNLNFKEDESPVTIADKEAEQAMRNVIETAFPEHTIYGEEFGAHLPGRESGTEEANLVWVLDPIDGTKSFITGKPLFGTLISLVSYGEPILGIIDQPILGERWVGIKGQTTKFNNKEVRTRDCETLDAAYLYATSPDMFQGSTALSFEHVCTKVRRRIYCSCEQQGRQ